MVQPVEPVVDEVAASFDWAEADQQMETVGGEAHGDGTARASDDVDVQVGGSAYVHEEYVVEEGEEEEDKELDQRFRQMQLNKKPTTTLTAGCLTTTGSLMARGLAGAIGPSGRVPRLHANASSNVQMQPSPRSKPARYSMMRRPHGQ